MNLLLVDDERLALEALKSAVSTALPSAEIHAFSKASEAMAFAKERKIDIAFLDIDMRLMNGLEMAKELQKIYPKTNIVFVTGFSEYAIEAFNLYASAYLTKPVSTADITRAVESLRYPVEEKRVRFHCFGNFEAFCDDKPIKFKLTKTKEMLAYLVDRDGAACSAREIMAVLFEDEDNTDYYQKLRGDLINTFSELGISDCITVMHGGLSVNRDLVSCDYFDFKDGKTTAKPTEYMTQYSFAECTFSELYGE